MSQYTIQAPADADGTFYCDTGPYPFVTFSSPLTGADAVLVSIAIPEASVPLGAPDVNGTITGLDSSNQTRVYIGGPIYMLTRTGHASAVGIYADYGSRRV